MSQNIALGKDLMLRSLLVERSALGICGINAADFPAQAVLSIGKV